jgi:hypothetical protein
MWCTFHDVVAAWPVFCKCAAVAAGVLPMSFSDQAAALRLAMCDDIGEASYVDSLVAAALVEALRK